MSLYESVSLAFQITFYEYFMYLCYSKWSFTISICFQISVVKANLDGSLTRSIDYIYLKWEEKFFRPKHEIKQFDWSPSSHNDDDACEYKYHKLRNTSSLGYMYAEHKNLGKERIMAWEIMFCSSWQNY